MSLQIINKEFDASNLDKNQYTISLFKECARVKIINQTKLYNVEIEIAQVLEELIVKFTREESSSVTVENAEKLIIAIWYTIDFYVSSFESIEDSIKAITSESIPDMYKKGKIILEDEFENTKLLYEEVIKNKLNTKLIAYDDTLVEGMKDFSKDYNIEFEPHECSCTIDYPLAFDDWNVKGISYIKNYLWNLYIENKICDRFDYIKRERVLDFYGKMYKINYMDLLINIFEIIITNAVFSVICKNPSNELDISEKQFNYLNENLEKLNQNEIEFLICESIDKIINDLNVKDYSEINYIEKYKKTIIDTTISAIKGNNLKNILVITEDKEVTKSDFSIDEENKLVDEEFRIIIEDIMKAKSIEDKINIIISKINSIKDFIELLKSNCLFKEEYIYLFDSLSDIEIAMLGKYVFYGEYRIDDLKLSKDLLSKIKTNHEYEDYYLDYIKTLDKTKLKSIEDKINSL